MNHNRSVQNVFYPHVRGGIGRFAWEPPTDKPHLTPNGSAWSCWVGTGCTQVCATAATPQSAQLMAERWRAQVARQIAGRIHV